MLFGMNDRQNTAFMTSAGNLSGGILSVSSGISDYFGLKAENTELATENAMLRDYVEELLADTVSEFRNQASAYGINVLARVIDNSIRKDDNYITIDRGTVDGLEKGMGVYNARGVIGVVMLAGSRNSIVLPILNSKSSISCKIKGTDHFGFLEWHGGSPYDAKLKDIPYQSEVAKGDTVVTSGFSQSFPESSLVGIVNRVERRQNDHTLDIDVRLATDMTDLGWVYVHTQTDDPEIEELNRLVEGN